MAVGEWSYEIRDTQTGAFVDFVYPSAGSWVRGSVDVREFTFKLDGDGLTRTLRRSLFKTWERAIVVRWNDVPVYAGLIVGRPYSPATRVLRVKHADARILLSKRKLFGVGSYNPSVPFDWTGYSTRGVVRQLFYYGLFHPYSAAWPISGDIEGAETGSSPWAKYWPYDMQENETILSQVEGRDDGPDTDLSIEYRSGRLYWVPRIGTPFLSGPAFECRLEGDSILTSVEVLEDALEQATGIFTVGRGSEVDMRVGSAALPPSVGVSRDYSVSFKDVDDQAALNSLASGRLAAATNPRVEWRASGHTSVIAPDMVRVGSILSIWVEDDPWLDDGWNRQRVLSFSGSVGSDVLSFELEAA